MRTVKRKVFRLSLLWLPVLGIAVAAAQAPAARRVNRAIDLLEQRIDAEGHAMGEQRQPAGIVKGGEPVPQRLLISRQSAFQAACRSAMDFADAPSFRSGVWLGSWTWRTPASRQPGV